MPIKKYDWIQLKNEFFLSEFNDVAGFIRQRLGKETAEDGNTAFQTKGWTEEKKEWKRELLEEVRRGEIDKFKVNLEELLATKKLSYQLMRKYLTCFGKILNGEELTSSESNFMKSFYVKSVDTITKWVQIELGLPTNISEIQGNKEKPFNIISEEDQKVLRKALDYANGRNGKNQREDNQQPEIQEGIG
jgi:hypothetical protein